MSVRFWTAGLDLRHRISTAITSVAFFGALVLASFPATAGGCPGQVLGGTPDQAPPTSLSNEAIEALVNNGVPWADGIQIRLRLETDELWFDLTSYPGTTSVAATLRVVWLVARLSDGPQRRFVFEDGGRGLFEIDANRLKDMGCRFVVGQEGGENPIALMREFYDSLVQYDSKERVASAFTGSLLGDTMMAVNANNDIFVPAWVISAVK